MQRRNATDDEHCQRHYSHRFHADAVPACHAVFHAGSDSLRYSAISDPSRSSWRLRYNNHGFRLLTGIVTSP
jgi:hypothetical protein